MTFRGTKSMACVGVIAAVALVAAGCGSSSNSSSASSSNTSTSSSGSSGNGGATAPGVTATSITFGTHQPLTGPAAPGYSEIAPASKAFFNYVNANGGVYGRKINLIIKDDAYNPTNTVNVVHQLVLQNKVFGIFEGLGTPTHTKVVGFLNAEKVPDIFVASGLPLLGQRDQAARTRSAGSPNYTIEGKILGQYIKQHFAGKKVGVLYQDDDFGQGGLAGIEDELPGLGHRLQAALPAHRDHARAAGHRDQVRQGQGRWSTSPSRPSRRSLSSPRSRSATSRSSSSPTSASIPPRSAAC